MRRRDAGAAACCCAAQPFYGLCWPIARCADSAPRPKLTPRLSWHALSARRRSFAYRVPKLLDYACGRGGDLHKWKAAQVRWGPAKAHMACSQLRHAPCMRLQDQNRVCPHAVVAPACAGTIRQGHRPVPGRGGRGGAALQRDELARQGCADARRGDGARPRARKRTREGRSCFAAAVREDSAGCSEPLCGAAPPSRCNAPVGVMRRPDPALRL